MNDRFGGIDVLEYSPLPPMERMWIANATTVESAQYQLDFSVLGAIAAVQCVLPGMRAQEDGALLFTTAGSATDPVPMTANFAIAAAGVRSYVRTLNKELAGEGIYAGIVEIGGFVENDALPDAPKMPMPEEFVIKASTVGDTLWELAGKRDRVDVMLGDMRGAVAWLTQTTVGG